MVCLPSRLNSVVRAPLSPSGDRAFGGEGGRPNGRPRRSLPLIAIARTAAAAACGGGARIFPPGQSERGQRAAQGKEGGREKKPVPVDGRMRSGGGGP